MKFLQKIVFLLMYFVLFGAGTTGFAQIVAPTPSPFSGIPLFGGAQQQQQPQTVMQQDTSKPSTSSEPKLDEDKLKAKEDLELDNKLMQLKKERILLEMELSNLKGSGGDTTIQDSINLAIKKKNLELLFLREQVLLKSELEKLGLNEQVFPAPSIFGQEYFRNPRLRMLNAPKDITPSESYILGTGDHIQIDIWGKAGYNANFTVDEGGFITIPRKQKVYLKGRTLTEARDLLKSRFAQIVNLEGSSFDVSVSHTRSISVHITGEVFYPGTYTLSALNSVFNILTVAGGPKNVGSVREILLQRGGVVIDTFDLYEYLFNSSSSSEKFLQNNDKLIVPLSGKKISISGPIKRSGTFELKKNENMLELINLIGGFETRAYLKDVIVKRFVSNSHAQVLTINLDSLIKTKNNFVLQDGDNITVKSIIDIFEGIIELNEGVNIPGMYQLQDGDRISDIIERAGGLNIEAFMENAYLLRINDDLTEDYLPFRPTDIIENKQSAFNYELQNKDRLQLFNRNQFIDKFFVKSSGSLRMPASIPYTEGLTANMLIKFSGGIKREAYTGRAYIVRNVENYNQQIIPLVLDTLGHLVKDVVLLPSDRLTVYAKLNRWKNFSINVFGEAENPGSIDYSVGITLYDVLLMSGGLTKTAENKEIEIVSTFNFDSNTNMLDAREKSTIRKIVISKYFESNSFLDSILMNPFDEVYIRNQYINSPGHIELIGEVKYPGTYAITSGDETIRDIIARAGGFTSFASRDGIRLMRNYDSIDVPVRLIVNWDRIKRNKESRFNYTIWESDKIVIPKMDKTVLIIGELNGFSKTNSIATYYKPTHRAKYYITHFAGGFSKEISKKDITVEHKNGSVRKTKNFILFKVYPKVKKGSTINVPTKEKKNRKKFSIDATLTKIVTTTTTLLMVLALINLATGK